MNIDEFVKRMLSNFDAHFQKTYNTSKYPNQNYESCVAMYDICRKEEPLKVVEIGTNYGASTLSLAYALKSIGRNLKDMLTIDLSHKFWKTETPVIQKELLKECDLDIDAVQTLAEDFNKIEPEDVIDSDAKTLIFYDMHDHRGPWSQRLLNMWFPLVKEGIFVVHDISPVPDSFLLEMDEQSPRTKAKHFNGQMYAGFNECARIIGWMNENNIAVCNMPGCICFRKNASN